MPWSKTGATNYHAYLGQPNKGCTINGLSTLLSTVPEGMNQESYTNLKGTF